MHRRSSGGVIEEICKYFEETEVPSTFALWSSIFTVAECLGRDCFIDQGHFTVYPNMYVVLVAGSAKCRKSTAIRVVANFIKQVDPAIKILSQKLTPEAMISALSSISRKGEDKIIEEAVGCFVNDELSTLIDKNAFNSSLIPVLTKLYDCDDFEYETKSRGAEAVRNPCLSILGGSTIEWIKRSLPMDSIGGGFTSRIVFVFRASRERTIPWPTKSKENIKREGTIVHDLNLIRQMRGAFGVAEDALKLYKEVYSSFLESPMASDPYLSGYAGRRHITLLKTAMALSASRSSDREISLEDMSRAIKALRNVEGGMDTVMKAITSEPIGDICEQVASLIVSYGSISKARLIHETKHRISYKELEAILEGLIEGGYVSKKAVSGKIVYKYDRDNEKL